MFVGGNLLRIGGCRFYDLDRDKTSCHHREKAFHNGTGDSVCGQNGNLDRTFLSKCEGFTVSGNTVSSLFDVEAFSVVRETSRFPAAVAGFSRTSYDNNNDMRL